MQWSTVLQEQILFPFLCTTFGLVLIWFISKDTMSIKNYENVLLKEIDQLRVKFAQQRFHALCDVQRF